VAEFELVGELDEIETIAVGRRIRDLPRLRRLYGKGLLEEDERQRADQAAKWPDSPR
jgi:hypothetical protein